MKNFNKLDNYVLLRTKQGVYRQAQIAERDGQLFAVVPGGYIMLYEHGVTSNTALVWTETDIEMKSGRFGRLQLVA